MPDFDLQEAVVVIALDDRRTGIFRGKEVGDVGRDHRPAVLSEAAARIAAGLFERQCAVRGDVHLHIAAGRLQLEAPELLFGSPVMVDIVDAVRGVVAAAKRRNHRFGNLVKANLGLGVLPYPAAVEEKLTRRTTVDDIHLGHALFVIDIRDAGVRIMRANIFPDTRYGFRPGYNPRNRSREQRRRFS